MTQDASLHTILGCGSTNTVQDRSEPQLWDCLDCGISVNPRRENAPLTQDHAVARKPDIP